MQLDELYKQHFSDVYRFALRLTGNRNLAEDITAETFFKAMRGLDDFRGDCSVKVWLCQIARNSYLSSLKKNRKQVPLEEERLAALPDNGSGPEELALDRAEADLIRGCLHELDNPYKEVFMWRVYAEMSFEQIGALFGKTSNWACVVYHRARRQILEKLEETP